MQGRGGQWRQFAPGLRQSSRGKGPCRSTTNTGFMIFSVDLLRESDGLVSPLVAGYQIVNDAIPEATNRETIDLRGFSCAIQL